MDRLISEHESLVEPGTLGDGSENRAVRRSSTYFFAIEDRNEWLYRRIWAAAQEFNRRFLRADLSGVEGSIQLTRYDSTDQGFYTWHTDVGELQQNRKVSITIQLSRSEDYDGGDLEFLYDLEPRKVDRTRGTLIAFPSFVLHRVTPVTRGTRWSLVAWVSGPPWR